MTIEITPTVFISAAGLLVILFAKIWSLGARVEATATRDELAAKEAAMRKDFDIALRDRTKDSVQEHANLASKSALTEVKADIFDFKKEVNEEIKELRASLDVRFDLISQADLKIQDALVKITHYVTPKGGSRG